MITHAFNFPAQQFPTTAPSFPVLPYVSLGTTDGVETEYVGHFDDGVSHAIHIPNGFPFGTFLHSSVYVSLNNCIAFSQVYLTKKVCLGVHELTNELLPHFFTSIFILASELHPQ